MWDATSDPGHPGEHTAHAAVGVAGAPAKRTSGAHPLTFSVDQNWLTDKARVFPVTIDPFVLQVSSFDTYVATGTTDDLSGWTTLAIGTQNSGTTKRLAYLNFTTAGLAYTHINYADVKAWSNVASNCSAGVYKVFGTISNADTGTRWTNRPHLRDYYGNDVGQDAGSRSRPRRGAAPASGSKPTRRRCSSTRLTGRGASSPSRSPRTGTTPTSTTSSSSHWNRAPRHT
jgi:hypothetical protein